MTKSEMIGNEPLLNQFENIDECINELEEKISQTKFDDIVSQASALCVNLLNLYARAHQKELPPSNDLLVLFKAFVKGDTSLTAVRDNVRELVFYRNCIIENRLDALPLNPEKMTIHTIRHIYFYLRSRADQEDLLG